MATRKSDDTPTEPEPEKAPEPAPIEGGHWEYDEATGDNRWVPEETK